MTKFFKKDPKMKYTDMAIYVDTHMKDVIGPNASQEVENKILEYLYHIVYSLSWKKGIFKRYEYYDEFSLYAAGQLFMTLRRRLANAGQIIRGREVIPVKSCLNFIKAVLYPFKVDFEKSAYNEVLNPEIDNRLVGLDEELKENIRASYRTDIFQDIQDSLLDLPNIINEIIDQTPFKNDVLMRKRLYISCLLTFINQITLPNKIKYKLQGKNEFPSDKTLTNVFYNNDKEAIVWHLDPRFAGFIQILTYKIKRVFTDELLIERSRSDLSDEVIDTIMQSAFSTYDQNQDEEY